MLGTLHIAGSLCVLLKSSYYKHDKGTKKILKILRDAQI